VVDLLECVRGEGFVEWECSAMGCMSGELEESLFVLHLHVLAHVVVVGELGSLVVESESVIVHPLLSVVEA